MLLQVIFIKAVKDGTKIETKREESTHRGDSGGSEVWMNPQGRGCFSSEVLLAAAKQLHSLLPSEIIPSSFSRADGGDHERGIPLWFHPQGPTGASARRGSVCCLWERCATRVLGTCSGGEAEGLLSHRFSRGAGTGQ